MPDDFRETGQLWAYDAAYGKWIDIDAEEEFLEAVDALDTARAELTDRETTIRVLASMAKPTTGATLNDCECAVVQAIHENGNLTGPEIAAKTGYPYSGHLKSVLSSLRKRGIIHNTPGKGYQLAQSAPSPD